ncbi:hypothetical protein ABQE45_03405 [Mycobacteroides chelonae]
MARPPRDKFPNAYVGDLAPNGGGWTVVSPLYCPNWRSIDEHRLDPALSSVRMWRQASHVDMPLSCDRLRAQDGPELRDPERARV